MDSDKKYKILIIDDDSFILSLEVPKFKKAGHEVDTAKSAEEALTKIKDGYSPDIILIDVVLPDMNGLDFLANVRKENLVPNAACIMVTNQNSGDETERAQGLGVAGYIIKAELVPSELVAKVLQVANSYKK